jgi:TRAP transporter T-component
MVPVFETSMDAFYEESDLQIAEQAIASNLKLLEGLLKNDPENEELLLLLAQGYSGYALGFVEDENPQRAKIFYERAFSFGLRAYLGSEGESWQWSQKSKNIFEEKLNNLDQDEVPALFWTIFAMAGKINVSLDDPAALINVSILENAIDKIKAINPGFFYGSVYLLKGSIEGMKPRMLGGNPQLAKENFEKNIEITKGQFLLTKVYQARFFAAKTLDEALFDQLVKEVEDFDTTSKPEIALFNQIAKKKAALLKSQRDELF